MNEYPVLEDHISASEVITPHGSDLLIYDTVTGMKKHCNRAVMDFLKLATGTNTFKDIIQELSQKSGESSEDIWPGLAQLSSQMVKSGLLKVIDSPFANPRQTPSVELVHRLVNISFETTRKCNLRCKHCYTDAGVGLEDELTVEEIKELIDELADMGVLSITFTGGEPLMHPHIFELMEYAKKKPLTVLLFTNGTLLTEEIVEKLKEMKVLNVSVSIDGPDSDTHDAFRSVKGSFEKTIHGVNLLRKAGIPVRCSISVTKFNFNKIKEIFDLVNDLGISEFKMWFIAFSGRSGEKNIFITPEEFREVMEQNRQYEIEVLGKERKEEVMYSKKLENCGVGRTALSIKCNGTVTPCPSFREDVSLGNIRNESLVDIWNKSPLLNKLRAMSVLKTEHCQDCDYALICKGGCIADVLGRTGKFSCYDEYKCIAVDMTKDNIIPVEVEDIQSDFLTVEIS